MAAVLCSGRDKGIMAVSSAMAGMRAIAVPSLASAPWRSSDHREGRIGAAGAKSRDVLFSSIPVRTIRHSTSSVNKGLRCSGGDSVTSHGNVLLFDENVATLEEFIANVQDKLVVLDISTKTCGPCKLIYPKLVKMSIEYPDAVFLKINGDYCSNARALMRKWKIRAVPTFRFFRNGEMIHSHSGAKEDDLRAHFLEHYMTVSVQ